MALTVPVWRGGILALFLPIAPSAVSFSSWASVYPAGEVRPEPLARLHRRLRLPEAALTGSCVIEIEPIGHFLISRVGLPVWRLRDAAA